MNSIQKYIRFSFIREIYIDTSFSTTNEIIYATVNFGQKF